MYAEDETAIIAGMYWDIIFDEIIGSCGLKCAAGCLSAPECKNKKCADKHECAWRGLCISLPNIGDDAETYEKVMKFKNLR